MLHRARRVRGPGLKRNTYSRQTCPSSDPSITIQSSNLGDVIYPLSGATRIYQAYYRDANVTFCPNPPGNTFNVSSAITFTW